MKELSHSLHSFINALNGDNAVHLTAQGHWWVETRLIQRFCRLSGLSGHAKLELLASFNKALDRLESIPVNFSQVPGVVAAQEVDFHGFLSASQAVRASVKNTQDPRAVNLLKDLKIKELALLYRLEGENGGIEKKGHCFELTQLITTSALVWKKTQKIFWEKELLESELDQLKQASYYGTFVKNILTDTQSREDFFIWVLRDGLPVDIYIQFPALVRKIKAHNLAGRIGRMGPFFMKLCKIGTTHALHAKQKIVTLPFEGHEISLLDWEKEFIFRGNYKVKLKEVFRVFSDKNKDLGNFEMFGDGIQNWNSNCMGWWDHDLKAYELVDLDFPDWWQQLPALEVLTLQETNKRFGSVLDGRRWILTAKSARESVDLDYEGCHAYVEMAIPSSDRQYYVIYTFGKAKAQLPKNAWERLFSFGDHVLATIVYPDETMFFTHRQQIGYSFELTEDEGRRLMGAFREDIHKARSGNMVFQVEAENCGKWIQNHLEEHLGASNVPNLYRFPILGAEPKGFMAKFFKAFRCLPAFCRNRLFILIHYPLGAWRGRWVVDKKGQKVWKSLLRSSFWQDAMTYMPAFLHKQHESGVFVNLPSHQKLMEGFPAAFKKSSEPRSESVDLFGEDCVQERSRAP